MERRIFLIWWSKLATAKANKPDCIVFDEPEIFMHDDMIELSPRAK